MIKSHASRPVWEEKECQNWKLSYGQKQIGKSRFYASIYQMTEEHTLNVAQSRRPLASPKGIFTGKDLWMQGAEETNNSAFVNHLALQVFL